MHFLTETVSRWCVARHVDSLDGVLITLSSPPACPTIRPSVVGSPDSPSAFWTIPCYACSRVGLSITERSSAPFFLRRRRTYIRHSSFEPFRILRTQQDIASIGSFPSPSSNFSRGVDLFFSYLLFSCFSDIDLPHTFLHLLQGAHRRQKRKFYPPPHGPCLFRRSLSCRHTLYTCRWRCTASPKFLHEDSHPRKKVLKQATTSRTAARPKQGRRPALLAVHTIIEGCAFRHWHLRFLSAVSAAIER